jgi:hypothetical protein
MYGMNNIKFKKIFVSSIQDSEMLKVKVAIPILDKSNTATHVRVIGIWRDSHSHELHIFPC